MQTFKAPLILHTDASGEGLNWDADALSRIQWPGMMEMNSQTVKAVCEGVQTSHGKVEILSHSAQTLSHLLRDSIQPNMTPAGWSQGHPKIPFLIKYLKLPIIKLFGNENWYQIWFWFQIII